VRKRYYLETRCDVLIRNKEVFARWAKMGLCYMFLGLESLDAEQLKAFRKRATPNQNFEALEVARKLNIDVAINLISDPSWGREEFERLLREYWWQEKPAIDPFQVAITFMDRMPRDELLAALRHRAANLRAALAAWDWSVATKMNAATTPRHIAEQLALSKAYNEATLRWLDQLIEKVERGELP